MSPAKDTAARRTADDEGQTDSLTRAAHIACDCPLVLGRLGNKAKFLPFCLRNGTRDCLDTFALAFIRR